MKKSILIVAFIATVFGIYSCQNKQEDVLANFKGKAMDFESFFEKVSNEDIKIDKNKVLLINYEWDAQNKTISVLSAEQAEPSWGLAFDVAEQQKKATTKKASADFTVSCNKGGKDGKGWKKSCDGKWSCGKLVYSCVEVGGCATVCKAPMAYVIETKTFYISNDIEDLIELESK